MIKNILFDWSGTLSDDFNCTYVTNMAVFRRLGLAELSAERFREEFTLPYMDFYSGYTDTAKGEVDRIFAEEFREPPPQALYPGVKGTLASLRRACSALVILSTCGKEKLLEEMTRFGILDYFDEVRGGVYDKVREVPRILVDHSLLGEETAFVGDMTHDIEAGNEAGIISVAITWGYQAKSKLATRRPTYIIDRLEQLHAVLDGSRTERQR
jgi:phosphoglycolate phosphatase